jgi:asparagine synthase (glutamine-hydrolysing)
LLQVEDENELYERLISLGQTPISAHPRAIGVNAAPPLPNIAARLMYRDMAGYLPGDILVKLDRASMAVSLEARCPLLDHRVVEFAWRLPTATKIRHGSGKWPLRRVLRRYLPEALFERPKHGFDVPIGAWLKGPLRDWAEDLLAAPRLARMGFLDPSRIKACWHDHLSGRHDRAYQLWAILMLEAWFAAARKPDLASFIAGKAEGQTGRTALAAQ